MNIWIVREFRIYPKLVPQAKEAFILLATCYEMLVRTTFKSKSLGLELEKLPQDSQLDVHIVAAMDVLDWSLKFEKLSNPQFKSLCDQAREHLRAKPDKEINSFLQDIRRYHHDFSIGIILGGKMGRAEPHMTEFDRLLVGQQTRQLVRQRIKLKQT